MTDRAETVPSRGIADVLALGFGVVVSMWAAGYVGRLPSVMAPSTVLLVLFVACVIVGGFLAGRYTLRGWLGGAQVGLVAGAVNLLVLGAFLAGEQPNEVAPSAALWVPGFVLASAALGGLGALAASRGGARTVDPGAWVRVFSRVAVAATLLLLAVGGLVTSHDAGLAVVDWPNSYGYNMFLFPLSRMTGGIYYEHAHRLFGALVGLTTLVLAGLLQRFETRTWVRRLGWAAVAMVIAQGILGGLRVTGRFTFSQSLEDVEPNVALAVVHGVLGQLFLGAMVILAAATSRRWLDRSRPVPTSGAGTDRVLTAVLVTLLVVQIAVGAIQRHLAGGLMVHVSLAVLVALVAVASGARAWGLNPSEPVLGRLGKALMGLTVVQLLLGAAAMVATGPLGSQAQGAVSVFQATVATAHQWCGALLLAAALLLALWTRRLRPGAGAV